MKKKKIQWEKPDYYPLEQALIKSGGSYNGDVEGATIIQAPGDQYTAAALGTAICDIIFTVPSTFSIFYTSAADDICDIVFNNFDLSINYCSVCL